MAAMLLSVATGCTQNNGHIGKLFGSWVLTGRLADGEAVELPSDGVEYYMSFQGTVVRFTTELPRHDYLTYVARWSQSGDVISFDFNNTSDANPNPGTGGFAPPVWMFEPELLVDMNILKLDNGKLSLLQDNGSDAVYIYNFERTW